MQDKKEKCSGLIPTDIFDLLGNLLICYRARKEILIIEDTTKLYFFFYLWLKVKNKKIVVN